MEKMLFIVHNIACKPTAGPRPLKHMSVKHVRLGTCGTDFQLVLGKRISATNTL